MTVDLGNLSDSGLDKMDNLIPNVADTPNSEKDLHLTN
jgi:hypothetical protein